MSVLNIKGETKCTLLVDSAVLLNCKPLKCVTIVRRGPRSSATGRSIHIVERRVVTKAKLAEDAAVCTSCILCWKSTKKGESDFCSGACDNLAGLRAPFLIEIPRGHVAFKKVAELFTSDWQASKAPCPTIKRVYMVSVNKSFKTSFEKYSTKIGSHGVLQKKKDSKATLACFLA